MQTVMGQTAHSTADGAAGSSVPWPAPAGTGADDGGDSDQEDAEPRGPSSRSFPDHPDHLLYESVRVLYEAVQGEREELGYARGASIDASRAATGRPPSPRSSATVRPESPTSSSPPRPSKTESSAPGPKTEPPSDRPPRSSATVRLESPPSSPPPAQQDGVLGTRAQDRTPVRPPTPPLILADCAPGGDTSIRPPTPSLILADCACERGTSTTHQERAPPAKARRRRRRVRARTQAPLRLGQEVRAAASSLQ